MSRLRPPPPTGSSSPGAPSSACRASRSSRSSRSSSRSCSCVLFAYVFGGAIPLPGGGSYREYLMPGIFVQTLAFASITTAIAFADDMTKGIIDRFRSLPMARSAVLSGRTFADVLYTLGILVVLMLSGLVVGWRVHSSLADFLFAVLLMVFFTYAMAWVGVYLGLVAPTVETVQQLGFLIIFPLTFLSNAFVPTATLPDVLQPIAEWNPISALTQATRQLFGNPSPYPSRLVSERAPVPALDPVDRCDPRRVRPARHPQVPGDRPLTRHGYDPARRGLRPHFRAGADPRHRPLVRARASRARRRGARPPGALPRRARARDGRARPDGHPDRRALRRRGRRHRRLRDRDRGADADRLVRRDHGRRPHLARDDADLPLRLRGVRRNGGSRTSPPAAGWPRSGSPSRTRARTPAPPARPRSCATAPGSSTARRCSSPTPVPS